MKNRKYVDRCFVWPETAPHVTLFSLQCPSFFQEVQGFFPETLGQLGWWFYAKTKKKTENKVSLVSCDVGISLELTIGDVGVL